MSRNTLVGVVVVIALVSGGWWYLNQPSVSPTATEYPTLQENTNTTAQPTTNYVPSQPTQQQTQQPTQPAPAPAPKPETAWKIYQNSEYGFQFSYPGDWKLGTPQQPGLGYRVETLLVNGNTAKFETWAHQTQIDVLSYQKHKGTFQGRDAYLYDFNACSGEMGSSNACIEKVIQVLTGTGNTSNFGGREYLNQMVIEIRYGVHGNISQQASLQSSFTNVEPTLKQILSTFKLTQ